MSSSDAPIPNIFAARGRLLLKEFNEQNKDSLTTDLSKLTPNLGYPSISPKHIASGARSRPPELPVCIIGAGVSGLYAAMIFESLGIKYQIIDANTEERVGGRLFTHHFPGGGEYDYFDLGAMRFPKTPFMKRTFDLAENRGLKDLKFIPYIREMVEPKAHTWLCYNGVPIHNRAPPTSEDPFNVKGHVGDKSLATPQKASAKVAELLQPFRDMFRPPAPGQNPPDIEKTIKELFKQTNKFTMRSWMLIANQMDPKDVYWCETVTNATAWFDRSLTQIILDDLAVNWPTEPLPGPETEKDPNAGWWCFDGGSSKLPKAMYASLSKGTTTFKSPVTAISRNGDIMKISVNGKETDQDYTAVISTVPLPRLSLMDLTGVGIHDDYGQWSAIRQLQYGPAFKIGLKFKEAWWEDLAKPIRGGQSYTDLPMRTIVYPSYPENATKETRSKVLIASYCRTHDAERLSALILPDGTVKPELLDLVFKNLATVHGVTVDFIKEKYDLTKPENCFAWDWVHDPLTMGGYAFFGPGVYEDGGIYGSILQPAARGKLFFAGEATSACHAWVAGGLDSAWRAVNQYLTVDKTKTHLQREFWRKWGATEYWDEDQNKDLAKFDQEAIRKQITIGLVNEGVKEAKIA